MSTFPLQASLPLDRPRRLARHVVHHAVDALDLVDDARRDAAQHLVREAGRNPPSCRRSRSRRAARTRCRRCARRPSRRPCAPAAAPRTPARSCRRGRPCGSRRGRWRRPCAGCRACSSRHLARDADGEARPGERMAPDEMLGQAQLAAQRAHLVLEQLAQRLDQLQVHALGQAADVVVRLDGHRRPAGERHALDHVGVERALGQELGAAELLGLLLEHVDEQRADGLALGLRVGLAGQRREEALAAHRRAPAGC